MKNLDHKHRPSACSTLMRLHGSDTKTSLQFYKACPTVLAWNSPVSILLLNDARSNDLCLAEVFINDQSTDLQRLVTLVRSQDADDISCAFWMLYETTIDEVECHHRCNKLSVVSVLPYFESRVHLHSGYGLFYAKSLDLLSTVQNFSLSDDTRLVMQRVSSSSRACERPLIRCLDRLWCHRLCAWCTSPEMKWGVLQDSFFNFVSRFVDDWDLPCTEAARRLIELMG